MSRVDLKYIASLVEEARLQDSNAFASLFAITYQEQYALAYSILWDKNLAQDMLLDLYTRAIYAIGSIDRPKNFAKWLTEMNLVTSEVIAEDRGIKPPKDRKIPEYSVQDAERLLEFIFFENGRKPNSIPLESLIEYNSYQAQTHGMRRMLVLILIIGMIIAPFFAFTPKFTLEADAKASSRGLTRFAFTVDSFIPIDTAKASVGKNSTPVYQSGKRDYYIIPTENGKMLVTVKFITGRTTTKSIDVSGVDRDVPQLVKSEIKDDHRVHIFVKDSGSGINYDGVYGLNKKGHKVEYISRNTIIGEIVFDMPKDSLDIYIPDKSGNVLHASVKHDSK